MLIAAVVGGVVVLAWVLLNCKTSRPDGTLIARVHPYRMMLGHIMPHRDDAVVYFDTYARADKLLAYVAKAREHFHCDMTHCLVAACMIGLTRAPRMNRFVVGRRLYQRNHQAITFSAKRVRKDHSAKLTAIKTTLREGETFRDLVTRIQGNIEVERSGKETYVEKEMNLLARIPRAVMVRAVGIAKWLDYHNLLPASFIKGDGMYTSIFVANLGSIGMAAGYHHLYDWGTCPLFMMVGQVEERPMAVDGQVVVERVIPIRWSYDERIDDALNTRYGIDAVNEALENPEAFFGCLDPDGGDAHALDAFPVLKS